MMRATVTGLIAALSVWSCTDPTTLDSVRILSTDQTSYTVESSSSNGGLYVVTLEARFMNLSLRPVVLSGCNGRIPAYSVGMAERSGRHSGYNPIWGCGGGNIVVSPGETRNDVVTLIGAWSGELAGEMQLWYYTSCAHGCAADDPTFFVSNVFEVLIPD